METRDIDTPDGHVRVTVEHEQEYIREPRDHFPSLSDADVAAWRRDEWEFVTVAVQRLHYCEACKDMHVGNEFDSLGMLQLGSGDGWTVTLDDLISTYPVPEMITNLPKGS